MLVIAAAFGFQVLITLYMQQVLGYHPALAGLGLLPTAVVIGLVSLGASARLAGRFGPRAVLLAGLALVALALALLTRLPASGSYPAHLLPALLIFGLGGGLTLLYILIAFTPLYYVIVKNLIGAPAEVIEGCRFRPRCTRSDGQCFVSPPLGPEGAAHVFACHHPEGT